MHMVTKSSLKTPPHLTVLLHYLVNSDQQPGFLCHRVQYTTASSMRFWKQIINGAYLRVEVWDEYNRSTAGWNVVCRSGVARRVQRQRWSWWHERRSAAKRHLTTAAHRHALIAIHTSARSWQWHRETRTDAAPWRRNQLTSRLTNYCCCFELMA